MAEQTHEPQQQRSREKVARVLDAAADLLDSTPYEDLGTKRIAAEAGVSIGVLYRYFADKEAIAAALIRRWLATDLDIVDAATTTALPATPRELLARLVDGYAERFRTQPGYRELWYHGPRIAALGDLHKQTDAEIAHRVHTALVRAYGVPDRAESRRRALLAVEVGGRLLDLAFREDPHGDPAILADTSLILTGYLLAPADPPA